MTTSVDSSLESRWRDVHRTLPPLTIAASFLLAILLLRALDLFVLRLSWPDPTIVSRVLGALLVLAYVWSLREGLDVLGLHTRKLACALGVGAAAPLLLFSSLYTIELQDLTDAGEQAQIVLGIVDAPMVLTTGATFLGFYFAGQVINAFTEETIFRGIMLPHFMRTMSFWKANFVQASLFAVAHLVWPLSRVAFGEATLSQALSEAFALLVFTGVGGMIFGYLYYRTNSLWTPLLAHLIDNALWLFVHIETSTRVDAELEVSIFGRVAFFSLVLIAWFVATRSGVRVLSPWGTQKTSQA